MSTHVTLGDRAWIIKSEAGNEGKIVRVVRHMGLVPAKPFLYNGRLLHYPSAIGDTLWAVTSEGTPFSVRFSNGRRLAEQSAPFPDSWLRPLPKIPEFSKEELAGA